MINIIVGPEVNTAVPAYISQPLAEIFEQEVRITGGLSLEAAEWHPERLQYSADSILDLIPHPAPGDHNLAILEEDIFAFGLNYVFGEAETPTRKALISLKRIRPEYYHQFPDEELFLDRAVKEAVHELGHTYRLRHCPGIRCVMHFSNDIEDTDMKDRQFCPVCRRTLEKQIRGEITIPLRRTANTKKP